MDKLTREERRLICIGERLAAQLGGVFQIVPQKLADYRARATQETNSE